MAAYADEQTLEAEVERLAREYCGDPPPPVDELLQRVVIRRGLSDLLAAADARLAALEDPQLAAVDLQSRLAGLANEGLSWWLLADAGHSLAAEVRQQAVEQRTTAALLNTAQAQQFTALVDRYAALCVRAGATADLPELNIPDAELLELLTPEAVSGFLADYCQSSEWLKPLEAVLPLDKLDALQNSGDTSLLLPQNWAQLMFDEQHYVTVIGRYERLHQPLLADVARLLLLYGRAMRNLLAGDWAAAAGQPWEQLAAVDRYGAQEFAIFGPMAGYITLLRALVHYLAGTLPGLPLDQRLAHLERAENDFQGLDMPALAYMAPSLRWQRAQLLHGAEQEKLELSAVAQVNQALANLALKPEVTERVPGMATLIALPASWKLAKGQYAAAIEYASLARAFGGAALQAMSDEIGPTMTELQRDLANTTDPEAAASLRQLLDTLASSLAVTEVLQLSSDLTILTSQARLAEARGDFEEAYQLYHQAAGQEREIIDRVRKFMAGFLDVLAASNALDAGYQHEARATYYQGVAEINRGDRSLMQGDYMAASKSYLGAQPAFAAAAGLWEREAVRPGTTPDAQARAWQEAGINRARIRYCDARVEIAWGEQYSALGQAWEAAKRFGRAAAVFNELVLAAVGSEEKRSLDVLQASRDFCQGRWLLEKNRADNCYDDVAEGGRLLDSAALRFEQSGEERWGRYIRALRLQYDAVIALAVAQTTPSQAEVYLQLAQARGRDAAQVFRGLGLDGQARAIETWTQSAALPVGYSLVTAVLPKPRDPMTLAAPSADSFTLAAAGATPSGASAGAADRLRRLQARVTSLKSRLSELRDLRDRGRIDEGRYVDLATDLDAERMALLLEVKAELAGRDARLDTVIQLALNGEREEALLDRLAEIAAGRGYRQELVDALRNHSGLAVAWIIDIGSTLAAGG